MNELTQKHLSLHFLKVLEEVAAKATPGPWRVPLPGDDRVKMYGQVVADWKYRRAGETDDDRDVYGGSLICESVEPRNARFIALFDPKVALLLLEFVLRVDHAEFTVDEARVVRTWRVDLGCTEARISELVYSAWGYGSGHADGGHGYCAKAADLLGEDVDAPPWLDGGGFDETAAGLREAARRIGVLINRNNGAAEREPGLVAALDAVCLVPEGAQ